MTLPIRTLSSGMERVSRPHSRWRHRMGLALSLAGCILLATGCELLNNPGSARDDNGQSTNSERRGIGRDDAPDERWDDGRDPRPSVGDPYAVPPQVGDYFDWTVVETLEQVGFTVNRGDQPPSLLGSWLVDNLQLVFDENGQGYDNDWSDYHIVFIEERADGKVDLCLFAVETGHDECSEIAFVSGFDDCFSVYAYNTSITDGGCETETLDVYSGCRVDHGLVSFQLGFAMLAKNGTGCETVVQEGHRRVFEEEDGLVTPI